MAKIPAPFWAIVLAFMGFGIAIAVLYHHEEVPIALAVLGIGSNLVSGALGAFAGHAAASTTKNDVTPGDAPVTINQTEGK